MIRHIQLVTRQSGRTRQADTASEASAILFVLFDH